MPEPAPRTIRDGLRLGATTFTIAPVPAGAVNRATARVAMCCAPGYGLVLGAIVGGLAIGLHAVRSPAPLTGVLCVAAGTVATRGLHLDGLADTADALGSYAGRDRALAIMSNPEVGPFGVVAIGFALLVPAAAIAGVTDRVWYALLATIATGYATGRLAVTWACRRGVPAAKDTGLGALVAGTVRVPVLVVATLLTAALAVPAVPGRPWQGPLSVFAGLGLTLILTGHVTRRVGGVTGDVLGACVEIAAATALVVMALGGSHA